MYFPEYKDTIANYTKASYLEKAIDLEGIARNVNTSVDFRIHNGKAKDTFIKMPESFRITDTGFEIVSSAYIDILI